MSKKAIICNEFVTDSMDSEICTAYKKIPLPVYPSLYQIETFCMTENHVKCPVQYFSILINSCR